MMGGPSIKHLELYGFIAGEGSPYSGDPATFQALLGEATE